MDMREAFEKKFPLPRGLHWDEELGQYNVHPDFVFSDRSLDDKADIWSFRFEGYKAALSHIGDGSKVEPVKYEYQGQDGYWYGFDSEKHFQNTKNAGFPMRALYTHPAPTAQDSKVPEALPMRPYQTVDVGSTNYKAGWNACRKAMLSAAPVPDKPQWVSLNNSLPDYGVDVRVKLIGGDILEDAVMQPNGDFYSHVGGNALCIDASNVFEWDQSSLQRPAAPEGE